MLARGQHRNHDFGALDRGGSTFGDRSTISLGLVARGFHQIERHHPVAGLDQIGGHRAAHIAKTNECNACHLWFPPRPGRFSYDLLNTNSSAPISAK
jgi:hypothetical protein